MKRILFILPVLMMTTNVYARRCPQQMRVVYQSTAYSQRGSDIDRLIDDYIRERTQKTTVTQKATYKNTYQTTAVQKATSQTTFQTTVTQKPATQTTARQTAGTVTKKTVTEPQTEATTAKPAPASPSAANAASEILSLVNKERAARGLYALTLDQKLSSVAQAKAEDMYKKRYFSHTSPTYGTPFDMMKSFGISYKTAGENIAKGQRTPAAVMEAWMNSEGHRKNILGSGYTKLGVGYVNAGGTTYWVQMFIG